MCFTTASIACRCCSPRRRRNASRARRLRSARPQSAPVRDGRSSAPGLKARFLHSAALMIGTVSFSIPWTFCRQDRRTWIYRTSTSPSTMGTALPICRPAAIRPPSNTKSSGNFCMRAAACRDAVVKPGMNEASLRGINACRRHRRHRCAQVDPTVDVSVAVVIDMALQIPTQSPTRPERRNNGSRECFQLIADPAQPRQALVETKETSLIHSHISREPRKTQT